MSEFRSIKPEEITGNVFDRIGREWMLITAGDKNKFNTMTASWGGLGVLWNLPTAFCFLRPQRYTLEFVEKQPFFTLSFYDESHRDKLNFCGSHSGRDYDKVKKTGLTPAFTEKSVYFNEAELVLVCRKIYESRFSPEKFLDKTLIAKNYPKNDFHLVFAGEIVDVLAK